MNIKRLPPRGIWQPQCLRSKLATERSGVCRLTEGELVTIKFVQSQGRAGSFRHATQRTPKAHFIRFGEPLPRATFLPEEDYVAARQYEKGVRTIVCTPFCFSAGIAPACHLEQSPPEIPPSLCSVLLRSSTTLRFAQNDAGGRSRNPKGKRLCRLDLAVFQRESLNETRYYGG